MLKRIGLHIQRTQALTDIGCYIVERFDGNIPQSREELEEIPHVGKYTAAALRSFGFGIRDAVVDSNVMRILRRLFAKGIGKKKLSLSAYEELAMLLLPKEHQTHNLAMLDLGALVCRYDRPRCQICPLMQVCDTGLRRPTI
jgi:A/G-specific adenine glycosylase